MIQGLGELGWNITPPKATMYLWAPCPGGMTAADFALNALESAGVVRVILRI